jgi:uncharacterized protein involved in exopolysaccharide biosynthesis
MSVSAERSELESEVSYRAPWQPKARVVMLCFDFSHAFHGQKATAMNGISQQPGFVGMISAMLPERLAFARRHGRLIAGLAFGSMFGVVTALSLASPKYVSRASFMPQSNKPTSALAGVAASLGVDPSMSGSGPSSAFYVDLIRSRDLLGTVILAEYRYPSGKGEKATNLLDVLKVRGASEPLRVERSVRRFNQLLEASFKARTGMISIAVTLPDNVLAQQVTKRLIREVERFNLEQRQSQARAERRFTEERLLVLQAEVRGAEDRMQGFMLRNRDFRNSPQLAFDYDRLARDLTFRQAVYSGVAQSNEKARMDEVRDTPVITVVDEPSLPAAEEGRGRIRFGILAFVLGAVVAVLIGLFRDRTHSRKMSGDAATT